MSSGGFSGVLEMFEEVNRGVEFIINDPARKKFEKNFGKDLEGKGKTIYLCIHFRFKNGVIVKQKRRVL